MDETIFEETNQHYDSQTVGDVNLADFLRHETPLVVMGALRPVMSEYQEKTLINDRPVTVGRDPACDVPLAHDDSVPRQHARVRRENAEFVLEDLGSSNGTYVDGVPIVSCRLHGGDIVQIGRSLFLFDRLVDYSQSEDGDD